MVIENEKRKLNQLSFYHTFRIEYNHNKILKPTNNINIDW